MQPLRCIRKTLDFNWVTDEIKKISDLLVPLKGLERLYLFGSAAEGKMTDQSDLDFLMVFSTEAFLREAQKSLRPSYPLSSYPVDLVWTTLEGFESKKQVGGICMVVFEEGKCLFERENNK